MDREASRREADTAFSRLNRRIPVPSPVRVALAAMLLFGGAVLVFSVASLFFATPSRPYPHPVAAAMLAVLVIGMGCGFLFLGVRLARPARRSGPLLGRRTRIVCGLFFGAAAIGMGVGAWASDGITLSLQAVGVAVFSFLILRSTTARDHG